MTHVGATPPPYSPLFNKPNLPYSRCNSLFDKERNTVFPHRSKYTVYVTKFYISKSIVVVQCLFPISLPKPIEKNMYTYKLRASPHQSTCELIKKIFLLFKTYQKGRPSPASPHPILQVLSTPLSEYLEPTCFLEVLTQLSWRHLETR